MTKSIGQSRLLQQMKSMVKDKSDNIFSQPLQNDLFIWHFTILGPQNTDFHEGIYHGQIVLPFQYPFKPPDIYFFTKNGRFEVSTKICLTITQFHPQEWNAGWTIRTMLQAVISLFNEYVPGVGFLDLAPELRKTLAQESKNYVCPKCGPVSKILNARKPLIKQTISRPLIGNSPKKMIQKQDELQQIGNKIYKYQSASMQLLDEEIDQQLLLLQIELQNKRRKQKEKEKEYHHKRVIDEMAQTNKIQFQNYFKNNTQASRDKGLRNLPKNQIPSTNLRQNSPSPSKYSNKDSLASRIQMNMKIYQYAANLSNLSPLNN